MADPKAAVMYGFHSACSRQDPIRRQGHGLHMHADGFLVGCNDPMTAAE